MNKVSFGDYVRNLRENRQLPLRKVAAQLDIDTSTFSKVERGDRPISIEYLKPLSQILEVELKEIQVRYLADSINNEFGQMEFFIEGLEEAKKIYNVKL